MIVNDKRGNLRNIERFESLAFWHSSSAGRRFNPYTAHQNQPRTAPPPSSQPPCRHGVGSRTQKMFPPVPLLPGLKSNRLRKNYVGFAGLSGFSGSSGGASDPDNETDQTDQPPSRLSRSSRPSRVTILRRALVRVVAYMLCSQKRENGRSIEQAAVKLTGL